MSKPIEDYGFIGNMLTGALVARDGSIDWLCLPRFDSQACFAALLGYEEHGRWLVAPAGQVKKVERRYRPHTMVLETSFETESGRVTLIDFMPPNEDEERSQLVRIVRGDEGQVDMHMELVLRPGYGRTVPWVRRRSYGLSAVAGPDAFELVADLPLQGHDYLTSAEFTATAGECRCLELAYHRSYHDAHLPVASEEVLERTCEHWREWSLRRNRWREAADERWRDAVERSLLTLRSLIYEPTGGMVAAATTSLPESLGGARNWDYRFCWIRDATFTLYALLNAGYRDEAKAWREWLLRAVAGRPDQLQILYGLAGERWLPELEVEYLPGYEGSRPVRVGNAAHTQLQLDVYGELMDMLHAARKADLAPSKDTWMLQRTLLEHLESLWCEPDEGLWEVRGGRRHFTHSRLMAWVALDRAIRATKHFDLDGPVARWRALRMQIRAEIMERGFNAKRNSFVQLLDGDTVDASLLMVPLVGFLECADPRVIGTIEAVERDLMHDGLLRRYQTHETRDGLPGHEGVFLLCSFWLADCYSKLGRRERAEELFEHLLSLRNDVGLLAEEYDPVAKRLLGNFPQAFSHVGLVNTAHNLTTGRGAAEQRSEVEDEEDS